MIHSGVSCGDAYAAFLPTLEKSLAFLRSLDPKTLVPGIMEIEGRELFASVSHYETEDAFARRFETHDAYIDVQYVARGRETIGLAKRAALIPDGAHDSEKDVAFYHDPETYSTIILETGDYAVFFPQEAHKPGCSAGAVSDVIKVVVKIRVPGV